MQVRKRNGSLEPVNLEKIVNSIRRVCEDLPTVEPMKIAQKVVGGLVDGISTRDLDMQSIRTAVNLIIDDPVYSKVAARILSNVISKEVSGQDIQSFSQCIQIGFDQGLIDEKTKKLVMANKRKLNDRVRPERDWHFEYLGIQTIYDRYLLRHRTQTISPESKQRVVIETPQYFLMRVACGLANDAVEAVELYDLLSSLEYMTSTPTLFNSGTVHSQMSSCYLLDSPIDDIEDIYKRYSDIASLSKFAGGIGVSYSRIRSKGTLIKGTNGKSNGLIPWLHTLSGSVAAVNQCLHPNTKVYTSTGLKNIKDIEINDLVLGISGEYRPVQEVLKYDSSNERSLSISINNYDNPIVITDGHPIYTITKIDVSHDPTIEDYDLFPRWLEGKDLKVGDLVGIPKTENEKHTSYDFEYGDFLWSKIQTINEVETPETIYDLRVETDETYVVEGALVHNGGKRKGAACVYIEPWHPDIMSFLELRDQTGEKESRAYNLNLANWVPDIFMRRVEENAMWSLIDPSVAPDLPDLYGDEFEQRYIQLEAEGKFVEQIPAQKVYGRMMRTLAETGNGWMCFKDTSNKRGNQVGQGRTIHLSNLCTEILEVTSSGTKELVTRDELASLTNEDMITKNIRVVGFNTKEDKFEIIKGSEVSVCNLGSINLARGYVKNGKLDKAKLRKNVAIAVKYLDRVIDRNFYPIPEAKASNMRWRPIGLGVMGLADLFIQLRLPFESEEAIKLSGELQEEIYFQAVKTSCELAKDLGPHRDFELTRAAQGLLQFDLAGVTPKDISRWDSLKEDIRKYGMRNSLLLAIAPTATISHICGAEECIEPYKSNLLKRETLSGEFISINKYLVEDLKSLGKWNDVTKNTLIRDEGSVKNLDLPAEIKALYPTVWEMSMKTIIAHAAARGAYIDQSASTNLFVDLNKHPEDKRIALLSSMYRAAWKAGLKTTYYFRSRSATRIEQTTVTPTAVSVAPLPSSSSAPMAPEETDVCESCT